MFIRGDADELRRGRQQLATRRRNAPREIPKYSVKLRCDQNYGIRFGSHSFDLLVMREAAEYLDDLAVAERRLYEPRVGKGDEPTIGYPLQVRDEPANHRRTFTRQRPRHRTRLLDQSTAGRPFVDEDFHAASVNSQRTA